MATSANQLITEIKQGHISPVYLLTGDENHYIDIVSDYFENQFIQPDVRDFDQTVVYGSDTDMATVVGMAARFPMMSSHHLVLVKEAQNIDDRQWGLLESYLSHPATSSVLVLVYRHKKLDKRKSVYKAIAKTGTVFEANKLYDNQLPTFIKTEVKAHGHTIDDHTATIIADAIGNDLGKIANELSKVFPLLKPGEAVTPQLVEQQIGISKDYNAFELQKAIGRRDALMCNRIVNHFAANPSKNPLPPLLALLYGYFVKVMVYHQLDDKASAAKELGCPPSFVADYATAARNYSLSKLASCIGYLHQTDLRSKGVGKANDVTDGELLKELVFKIIH
ncbi:MAG: DNA polymerase III subunit delta [Bacteroidales bacterium]|nr:DNA polymerase III subunit delta [Bacteroidales bacterium]